MEKKGDAEEDSLIPEGVPPWALQGPPEQKLVWIATLVCLTVHQFLRQQERPPIAELATICPYASYKSIRQCWVRHTLLVRHFMGRTSPDFFRWSANDFQVKFFFMPTKTVMHCILNFILNYK